MRIAKKHALSMQRECVVPAAFKLPLQWHGLIAMLLGGLLLVPLPGLSQTSSATGTPKTVAYSRPHSATHPGKSGKKTGVAKDYLKITTLSPTEISFCLDTSGKNGSMCNLWGKATRGEGQKYTFRSGAGEQECVLDLTLTRDAWIVHDVTGACARQSCGAGAGVGEAKFLLRDRVQKIHPCESEAAGATNN